MKTASFVGVILPQTPVHLAQILNSIFQWGDLTQAHLHSTQVLWRYPIGQRTKQTKPTTTWIDPDLRVLSRKHISRDLRVFGVKFWTQIFVCVKNLTFRNSDWWSMWSFQKNFFSSVRCTQELKHYNASESDSHTANKQAMQVNDRSAKVNWLDFPFDLFTSVFWNTR